VAKPCSDDARDKGTTAKQRASGRRTASECREVDGAARRSGPNLARDPELEVSALVDRVSLPPPALRLLPFELNEILRLLPGKVVPNQVNVLLRGPAPATRSLAYLASAPERVGLQLPQVGLRGFVHCSKLVVCNVYASHSGQCLR